MSSHTGASGTNDPVVVATHGHCFDGMASAVLFTHLLRSIDTKARTRPFHYRAQSYDAGKSGVDPAIFVGAAETAILDYRYTATDRLTWYFDHHVSAFQSNVELEHFHNLERHNRGFFDAERGSCTKLIADVARSHFGLDFSRFVELEHWAHMIDRAAFPSAEMAVDRQDPEMRLMAILEQQGDDTLIRDLVTRLLDRPLSEVARDDDLALRYAPLADLHTVSVARIRKHAVVQGNVVLVDLLDQEAEMAVKFVTYADYPEVPYSVALSRTTKRCKLSVGYNPWCAIPRTHDIAKICERFGGGGHAVVGAAALPMDVEAARKVAREVVALLAS